MQILLRPYIITILTPDVPSTFRSFILSPKKPNIIKPTNLKLYTLAIMSLILSVTGIAQNKIDEEAVKACLENYMNGE